jgi:hypothetical protein
MHCCRSYKQPLLLPRSLITINLLKIIMLEA